MRRTSAPLCNRRANGNRQALSAGWFAQAPPTFALFGFMAAWALSTPGLSGLLSGGLLEVVNEPTKNMKCCA